MTTDVEPVFQASLNLPFNHSFTARLRPSTIRRTAIHLLPWALVLAMPAGGKARPVAMWVANRFSPLARPRLKSPF